MDRRIGDVSDEELLTRLAASFAVEPVEPDAASLRQLSAAVAERHRPATIAVPPRTAGPRTRRISLPRRLSPVVTIGSLVGALVMGTGISYAVGVPIPAAVRSVARTVGLAPPAPKPATLSPAVVAAQQAESTLHRALTKQNPSSAALSRDTSRLAHRLAQVGGDHTPGAQRVSNDGHRLLVEACPRLEGSPPTAGGALPATTLPDSTEHSATNPCAFTKNGGSVDARRDSPHGPLTSTSTTTPSGDHRRGVPGSGGTNRGQVGPTAPTRGATPGSSAGGGGTAGTHDASSGGDSSTNSGSPGGQFDR
jgi:hypothetical protein